MPRADIGELECRREREGWLTPLRTQALIAIHTVIRPPECPDQRDYMGVPIKPQNKTCRDLNSSSGFAGQV